MSSNVSLVRGELCGESVWSMLMAPVGREETQKKKFVFFSSPSARGVLIHTPCTKILVCFYTSRDFYNGWRTKQNHHTLSACTRCMNIPLFFLSFHHTEMGATTPGKVFIFFKIGVFMPSENIHLKQKRNFFICMSVLGVML